ncbi:hypothetical protein [Streptomyces wuyuanensis]|uniref:hypothetical protein n=1 Tax=Streptomyces wuyuanensis TaxID=1196353 RepID=UPI00378DE1FC
MILIQPVLEVRAREGFGLWPVAAAEPYGFLPLNGALGPAEVGTAVLSIAECNHVGAVDDGGPPRPADPAGSLLHGLLTQDPLFAAGGLRVTDTATAVTLLPGCCNGLEERGDWFEVLDGTGWASFGHDPSPLAERVGGTVRLTVDADKDGSPVIELSVTELRRLLAGVERDLTDFHRQAAAWAARCTPDLAAPLSAALARALDLPAPHEPQDDARPLFVHP